MADGKIYIIISDERSGNGNGTTTKETTKEKEDKDRNLWLEHEMLHFLKQQAQTMLNYAVSNIGNFQGDYQTQREIQQALSVGGILVNVGMAALVGLKMTGGNPIGAAVGAGISIASQSINYGLGELTASVQFKKTNYEIERMRDISGLNGLTNGSRI